MEYTEQDIEAVIRNIAGGLYKLADEIQKKQKWSKNERIVMALWCTSVQGDFEY